MLRLSLLKINIDWLSGIIREMHACDYHVLSRILTNHFFSCSSTNFISHLPYASHKPYPKINVSHLQTGNTILL